MGGSAQDGERDQGLLHFYRIQKGIGGTTAAV
jgi:hypothetical protein